MNPYPLEDEGDWKFWQLSRPNARRLLKEIIFQWRNCSAKVPGKPGRWAVYPIAYWCEATGLSRDKVERALKELVEFGLLNRERHRFAGSEVRAFLQPTALALKYGGRPQDLARIAGPLQGTNAGTSAGTGAATDYTPVPSSSPKSPKTENEKEDTFESGKGMEGQPDQLAHPVFPEKKGPHEKYVVYPGKKFANWQSFSDELKGSIYAKYLACIDNWYKGKAGKPHSAPAIWTEADEAALHESIAGWEQELGKLPVYQLKLD